MPDGWTNMECGNAAVEHPLAGRHGREDSVVDVSGVRIGGGTQVVIAGPCSVESEKQINKAARSVKASGATMLRGGAFKPRTSPYSFQGLEEEGLKLLRDAGHANGLPVVTEVMSEDHVGLVAEYADLLQIGARNMQNFALLKKLADCGKPLLLKRGPAATVKEWLSSAEYLLNGDNGGVVLCERGVKSFDPTLRNILDLATVALMKELTHLPVIVDPSHATGRRSLVPIMARAALATGCDGLIIEVHPKPEEALSDKLQQLDLNEFSEFMGSVSLSPTPLNEESLPQSIRAAI